MLPGNPPVVTAQLPSKCRGLAATSRRCCEPAVVATLPTTGHRRSEALFPDHGSIAGSSPRLTHMALATVQATPARHGDAIAPRAHNRDTRGSAEMDLSPQTVRDSLHLVDVHGWNSVAGRDLLDGVRRAVVIPVVRRSGLRGPAADQAEASGWEAAWDALRRPSARTAENPGGMVWSAVRRAVRVEVEAGRGMRSHPSVSPEDSSGPRVRTGPAGGGHGPGAGSAVVRNPGREVSVRHLSLDRLMDSGWQPTEKRTSDDDVAGMLLPGLVAGLVDAGWEPAEAGDAIAILAQHASARPSGLPRTRWRWAALRLGVPEWRVRRLAALLLGGAASPGVVELASVHGPQIVGDAAVQEALRSTTRRSKAGPEAWLAGWEPVIDRSVPA